MATVMPGLRPASQGVQFTARPVLRTRECISRQSQNGRSSSLGTPTDSRASPNASLSSIEIEALLREKVRAKSDHLAQAFQTYDVDKAQSVTKGEFRRVLESFCFPLTTPQFEAVLAKVDKNTNGTVRYPDFMDKFYGRETPATPGPGVGRERFSALARAAPPQSAREINVDMTEKMLKEKISQNMKGVIKAMQLFDYNRDGKIQRHEMRRVLENYCFKLSDQQFQKLWQRHDFHHTGLVNYRDFLQRIGVNVQQQKQVPEGSKGAMSWPSPQINYQAKKPGHRQEDELALSKMNFDQIELEFRKRMRNNHLNLKKIFMSFDRYLDGFIALDDLKNILIQFTIPMSEQLFTQLMERCGVRGTGKISWEAFLDKFQDPQSGGNGQTLPIKPSHKFFPIREGLETVQADDIWKLLYKHVHNHYPSIKNAFLQIDINRKEKITRKELRNIIEKFTFPLDDQQFKQMMIKLDPYHTNSISYQQFLNLFEETESLEGHKWLNSVHRFNENPKPAILAWETIEEILREKIAENWKNVANAIVDCDPNQEGFISPKKLKKVIDDFVLPVSDEHFEHMLQRCSERPNDKANYVEFLEKLNVNVQPGDLQGLSTQIHDGSHQRELKRLSDHFYRLNKSINRAQGRTGEMSADEVIARLKDRMSQHKTQIRQAFFSYDKRGKGKVSKRDFREVLASFGMVMTDEQFQDLTQKLNFKNGFMRYPDFIHSFDDSRLGGPGEDILRTDNHHVNPIRGDEYGMSAIEVESKLRNKLRENFVNLREAFYKFDENHRGVLDKESFRRLLDSFMCVMSDSEFEVLCQRMGINKKSRISYQDFLDRFEVRDTAEGHKWLVSCHRYNDTIPATEMTAEEVHEVLVKKTHQQWQDLSKAFLTIDSNGKGIITKKDLRDVLHRFILPITLQEFRKLWARYDPEGKGYISHQDFLKKMGAAEFTPGDNQGTSTLIIDHSRKHLEDHNVQQQMKHEKITLHQAQKVAYMTAEDVDRQLRDKVRDNYKGFYDAFKKYDTRKKGYLSVREVQKVLVDLNYFLDDEQFFRLLDKIGLTTDKSRLNYEQFLHAFEDGRKSSYGNRSTEVQIEEYSNLTPQEAENHLRELVGGQSEVLERAFAAFDKQQSGRIPAADFRRVLDLFCFKMTEPQWKHILSHLHLSGDNQISYALFLDHYSMTQQDDAERWLTSLQKALRSQSPCLMPIDEVQERLREAVSAHFYPLATAFADIDYANIGVVAKQDFRDVLNKHIFRLSDEQFDKLWGNLPVNEFGNLDYKEFLKLFSSEFPDSGPTMPASNQMRPSSAIFGRRPQTGLQRSTTKMEMNRPATMASRAASRMATPLVNAESAEKKIKDTIYRNWKDIQRQCRLYDATSSGTISVYDLKDILTSYGVDLPADDFIQLLTKYDLKENGSFCYSDFLRHFILQLKPQDEPSLLARRKVPNSKVKTMRGDTSPHFFDAMLRLRGCVVDHWKEMRREFRSFDKSCRGVVGPVDFRKVLRQFNVNLSEEEFYHLLSYYDKSLDGNISYNDFIRAYLQNP